MSEHTPGPWKPDGNPRNIAGKGRDIARVYGYFEDPEADANARLIVMAPEMLEALDGFVGSGVEWDGPTNRYITMQIDRDLLKDARGLIAKAEATP